MLFIILIIVITINIIIWRWIYSNKCYSNDKFANDDILPYDVIVVGCARNIETYLSGTKEKLEMIKGLFKSTVIYIYENDSNDKTLEILKQWESENFINLISEKNVPGLRTERLAHGRNILYNKAMEHNFDYLIVMDLDNVNMDLSSDGIKSCFNIEEKWAAVCANQTGNYYDIWALRTYDDWMPFDCWYCVNAEKKSQKYCVASRYKNVPSNSKPIKVKSAFGGFVIYDKKYLGNCTYGNGLYDDGNELCEHVTFNQCILDNGGEIYINPALINHNNTYVAQLFRIIYDAFIKLWCNIIY